MTYRIECDENGDIKVSVLRAIIQTYSGRLDDMPSMKPIFQWSVVGVAWKQQDVPAYNVFDIVSGGTPAVLGTTEDSALKFLKNIAKKY